MMITTRNVHNVLPVQVYVHQSGGEALVGGTVSQFTIAIVTPRIHLWRTMLLLILISHTLYSSIIMELQADSIGSLVALANI